jgi:hypothetical protein
MRVPATCLKDSGTGESLEVSPKKDLPTCTICFDTLSKETTTLKCKHVFDTLCIDKWFEQKSTCPICRAVVYAGAINSQISGSDWNLSLTGLERIQTLFPFSSSALQINSRANWFWSGLSSIPPLPLSFATEGRTHITEATHAPEPDQNIVFRVRRLREIQEQRRDVQLVLEEQERQFSFGSHLFTNDIELLFYAHILHNSFGEPQPQTRSILEGHTMLSTDRQPTERVTQARPAPLPPENSQAATSRFNLIADID